MVPVFELPRHIGLIGDVHGNLDLLARQANDLVLAGAELIVQLGDLGAHWDGSATERRRLERLDEAVRLLGTRVLVVPGNHENYDLLGAIDVGEDGVQWATPAVGYLPRGWRGRYGTRVVAALGGANSPDLDWRRAGLEWWAAEAISEADFDVLAAGGHADVLFTHDTPVSQALTAADAARGPSGFSPIGLEYAAAEPTGHQLT